MLYVRTNATMYIYAAIHYYGTLQIFKNATNNQVNILFYSLKTLKSNAILGRIQMIKLPVINRIMCPTKTPGQLSLSQIRAGENNAHLPLNCVQLSEKECNLKRNSASVQRRVRRV